MNLNNIHQKLHNILTSHIQMFRKILSSYELEYTTPLLSAKGKISI